MGLNEGQQSNLDQPSPDIALFASLRRYEALLREIEAEYAVIGSVGLQTYLPTYMRRPRDIDVLVAEPAIENLKTLVSIRELEFQEHPTASSIRDGSGFQLHLIPHAMRWVHRDTRAEFARPTLYFPDRLVSRTFTSIVIGEQIQFPVPEPEYAVGMSLVQPLSSELFCLLNAVVSASDLVPARVAEFFTRVPDFSEIAIHRLNQLIRINTVRASGTQHPWAEIRRLIL